MSTHRKVRTVSSWLVVACIAGVGALAVTAAPPERGDSPDRPRARRGAPLFHVLRGLGLSEEQRGEVRTILKAAKENRDAVIEENKEELDKIDAKIRELVEQRKRLLADAPGREEVMEQVSNVLTPEQQEKFKEKIEAIKEYRGERPRGARPRDGKRPDAE